MARPLKLHIVPREAYPPQRLNNCAPQKAPQEVEDMPQMAAFVYEFYIQKVQAMKSAFYVST
jgi:intron-binding protein aquarius